MTKIASLTYFAVLTGCSSMREAAEKLRIHPNVLARNIDQLEYYMNAPLVERSPIGIKLTAAGELLAAKLGRTINEIDHVVHLIDDLKGLRRGAVRLHVAEGIAAAILSPVLAAFSSGHPCITMELQTGTAKDAVRALEDAACDLALTFFAPASANVRVVQRTQLPQFIIARHDHPISRAGGNTIERLATYDWVLPGLNYGVRTCMDRASTAAGQRIVPRFEASSLDLQRQLVLQAGVLAVLPRAAVTDALASGAIVAVPFPEGMPVDTSLDLCVARDRQMSYAADALRRDLEQALKRTPGSNP